MGALDYMGLQSQCYDALTPDIMQSKRDEIGFLIERYPVSAFIYFKPSGNPGLYSGPAV